MLLLLLMTMHAFHLILIHDYHRLLCIILENLLEVTVKQAAEKVLLTPVVLLISKKDTTVKN